MSMGARIGMTHHGQLIYLSRLFRQIDLDFLCLTKYAPKNSALNPIEHGWSPLSKMLSSVRLPSTLPGENRPPSTQSKLTPAERLEKEAQVFDNAMKSINAFWNGREFDGFPISSKHQACTQQSSPFNDYDTVHDIISSGSKARITGNPDLHRELKFAVNHAFKNPRELCIVKCEQKTCLHCSTHPVRAIDSTRIIRNSQGLLLTPATSPTHPGHFMTYTERSKNEGDDCTMPSFLTKELGRCTFCRCYVFSSKEDRKRHYNIIHPDQHVHEN